MIHKTSLTGEIAFQRSIYAGVYFSGALSLENEALGLTKNTFFGSRNHSVLYIIMGRFGNEGSSLTHKLPERT